MKHYVSRYSYHRPIGVEPSVEKVETLDDLLREENNLTYDKSGNNTMKSEQFNSDLMEEEEAKNVIRRENGQERVRG